jgi:hypothetical protein
LGAQAFFLDAAPHPHELRVGQSVQSILQALLVWLLVWLLFWRRRSCGRPAL